MGKPALTYVAIHEETQYLDDDRRWQRYDEPKVILSVATPSGQIRQIELDDKDIANMLQTSAALAAKRLRNGKGDKS